ncbi:MAG: YciK family oxidoreductase [Pseudomonadota bacterium]
MSEQYPELERARGAWRYQPDADCLAGQTIVVTGAGAGIGRALARTCALYGADVVLLGRTANSLETQFDWICQHTSTKPVIVPCDLRALDAGAAATLAQMIEENFGRLDALINNASILGPKVPIAHYPEEAWTEVMQANTHAPFLLCRHLFELLDASPRGTVINVSSTVGREGRAYWGAYSASKFALEGLTQILADETEAADRMRVYSLNPGATRTSMRAQAYPGENPNTLPDPETHMDLFLYLLSATRDKDFPASGTPLDSRTWRA